MFLFLLEKSGKKLLYLKFGKKLLWKNSGKKIALNTIFRLKKLLLDIKLKKENFFCGSYFVI
jgi:hypothetical protein